MYSYRIKYVHQERVSNSTPNDLNQTISLTPFPGPNLPKLTPILQLFFLAFLRSFSSLTSKLSPLSRATSSRTGLRLLSILPPSNLSGEGQRGTPRDSNVGVLLGMPTLSIVGVRPCGTLGGEVEPSSGDAVVLFSRERSCRRGGEVARAPVSGRDVVLLAPDMARSRDSASRAGSSRCSCPDDRSVRLEVGRSGVFGHGMAMLVSVLKDSEGRGGVTRNVVVGAGA